MEEKQPLRKPGEYGVMETKERKGMRLGNNTGRLNKIRTEKKSIEFGSPGFGT